MNKNLIITILAALLAASIGAAFYFSQQGPLLVIGEANKQVCDTLPLFTGSLGGSGSTITPYIAQDVCHMVFAVEKDDVAICNNVKTEEFKGECYAEVANKKRDASICDTAPANAKDRCYAKVSERFGTMAACERIQQQEQRDNCLSNFASRNGDPAACKKITNINRRDVCYVNLAYQNPAVCNEIVTPQIKRDCQNRPNQ